MAPGTVVSIHMGAAHGARPVTVPEARAVAGRGLEGDRFFRPPGASARASGDDREVTLIEIEAVEALNRDWDLDLEPGEARRNIVTRGVPLNPLVGRVFRVGEVALRGLRLCDPCSHLAKLTRKEVLPGLAHRGGLRAQILSDGVIRVGDPVEEAARGTARTGISGRENPPSPNTPREGRGHG